MGDRFKELTALIYIYIYIVPLDDILRKFHLECCENVEITRKFECPTLGWKYPRQMLTMVSVLESQANHMFGQQKVS